MFSTNFYHNLFRKYNTAFGDLFSTIEIVRRNIETNEVIQQIPVPIAYGPKDKGLRRLGEDATLDQRISAIFPRMLFEITNLEYLADRQLNPIGKNRYSPSAGKLNTQFKYVPYRLSFSLYMMAKNEDDGYQILEQILPYFTPDFTVRISTVPEMGYEDNCVIRLTGIEQDKQWDGDLNDRRIISYTLNFTMDVRFYGALMSQGLIRKVTTNFYVPPNMNALANTPIAETIVTIPGLTANGTPTSLLSNSIPYTEIQPYNNYGIIYEYYSKIDEEARKRTMKRLIVSDISISGNVSITSNVQ